METGKSKTGSPRGFTLLEVMITLGIIAGMVALALPYVSNRNSQTKAFLRKFTVLSRELHTRAKLHGVVYRLVIDLGPELENEKYTQRFWVEKANGQTVVTPEEENLAAERAKETDEAKKKDPRGFEIDTSMLKKPNELPEGMHFDKVELSRLKNPVKFGKAFIHYMPAGLVDETAVHIKGEKTAEWTIAIHPLTGKAELISKPVSLGEIKNQ